MRRSWEQQGSLCRRTGRLVGELQRGCYCWISSRDYLRSSLEQQAAVFLAAAPAAILAKSASVSASTSSIHIYACLTRGSGDFVNRSLQLFILSASLFLVPQPLLSLRRRTTYMQPREFSLSPQIHRGRALGELDWGARARQALSSDGVQRQTACAAAEERHSADQAPP